MPTRTFAGSTSMPRERGQVARGLLAELRNAGRRAVVRLARSERRGRSLPDVERRVEVRLADLEVDDLAALPLELARPGEHAERRLGSEPLEAVGEAGRRGRRARVHAKSVHDETVSVHGFEPYRALGDLVRAGACDATGERDAVRTDELDRVARFETALAAGDTDGEEAPPLIRDGAARALIDVERSRRLPSRSEARACRRRARGRRRGTACHAARRRRSARARPSRPLRR